MGHYFCYGTEKGPAYQTDTVLANETLQVTTGNVTAKNEDFRYVAEKGHSRSFSLLWRNQTSNSVHIHGVWLVTLLRILPLLKRGILKRKEFIPQGSKVFPLTHLCLASYV